MRDVLAHPNFRAASIEVDPTTEPAVEKLLAGYGIQKHIDKLPTQRRGNIIYIKATRTRNWLTQCFVIPHSPASTVAISRLPRLCAMRNQNFET